MADRFLMEPVDRPDHRSGEQPGPAVVIEE
jgi:hypothetical protein